jgi:hypothetical protein
MWPMTENKCVSMKKKNIISNTLWGHLITDILPIKKKWISISRNDLSGETQSDKLHMYQYYQQVFYIQNDHFFVSNHDFHRFELL